jgi:hypothetical protein
MPGPGQAGRPGSAYSTMSRFSGCRRWPGAPALGRSPAAQARERPGRRAVALQRYRRRNRSSGTGPGRGRGRNLNPRPATDSAPGRRRHNFNNEKAACQPECRRPPTSESIGPFRTRVEKLEQHHRSGILLAYSCKPAAAAESRRRARSNFYSDLNRDNTVTRARQSRARLGCRSGPSRAPHHVACRFHSGRPLQIGNRSCQYITLESSGHDSLMQRSIKICPLDYTQDPKAEPMLWSPTADQ